ncbi:septal ring lytic transglycosylase RlpA family protein [Stomatohabitans albus]|uniref:septal ring lytic transglycosylase RlpA family protein n=1 Tax=Stomatohabitans albus TaxID=3110766 RepID=UPI00300C744D
MIVHSLSSKTFSTAAVLSALALSTAPLHADAQETISRVSGPGRIDTAAAAGLHQRDSASTVIIATANDWPDAIASTVLANDKDAPLLLTEQHQLPSATVNAIRKLKPSRAIVLGGKAAVSDKVISQLKGMKLPVERISGANRVETAAKVAREAGPADSGQVVITAGWGDNAWSNAIAASALGASDNEVPTLLVNKDEVPAASAEAIKALKPSTAVVVGNKNSVSDAVMDQLKAMGLRTTRVSGNSQYDISAKILTQNWDAFKSTTKVVFASGESFADGLAAGALAAHIDAPMMTVPKDKLGSVSAGLLRNWNSPIQSGVIVGGTAATSATVEADIKEILNQGVTTGEQSQATISDEEYEAMLAEIDVIQAPSAKPTAKPTPTEAPAAEQDKPSSDNGQVLSVEYGKASYYTDTRVAAPGERFDGTALAAAHKTLPFGSLVRVINEKNGKEVIVKINDRGPYIKGRVIDLTHAAAKEIDMMKAGVVPVKLEVIRLGY